MEKRYITVGLISLALVLIFITIVCSNRNHKTFKENGITYALMVDGKSVTSFPTKGMYQVDTECEGATASWDYDNWKLYVENMTDYVECDISFNSISKEYLNQKIMDLSGKMQGKGEVVAENYSLKNIIGESKTFYADLSNDTTYPWIWDDTNKTWTSSNKGDDAASTRSEISFSVEKDGNYQICYIQSSEQDNDYATIYYVDSGTGKTISLKGKNLSSYECVDLGYLSTNYPIRIIYEKSRSGNSGRDEVSFYIGHGEVSAYRYEGKNPNNFVWFNNELWRIMGVFNSDSHGQVGEKLVKIIRETSLGALVWDKSNNNNWETSSLKALLNGAYYNKQDGTDSGYCYGYANYVQTNCDYTGIGIDNSYRKMIKNVTWYLGSIATRSSPPSMCYVNERGTTSTTGYIGLMYPSDYGYSVLASSCARTTNLDSYDTDSICAEENWLYKGYQWTISTHSSGAYYLEDSGQMYDIYGYTKIYSYAVYPTLYLDSSVYVFDGDGSMLDPYIIGM